MRLPIQQPFDLASSVHSGQAHRWRRDELDAEWHWGMVCGNLIKIRQVAGESPDCPHSIEVLSAPRTEPEYLEHLLRSYFRLDDDIVVLDKRIVAKSYGKAFLDSIPPCTVKLGPMSVIPGHAAEWVGKRA